MTCIKTGARVLFEDYGAVAAADLHSVGDCIIIRLPDTSDRCFYRDAESLAGATHGVRIGHGWWRDDLGIAVVPADQIREITP